MDWNSMVAHIQERRTDLMREAREERLAGVSQSKMQPIKWQRVIHYIADYILRREHHHEEETHHHSGLTQKHQRAKHVHHG